MNQNLKGWLSQECEIQSFIFQKVPMWQRLLANQLGEFEYNFSCLKRFSRKAFFLKLRFLKIRLLVTWLKRLSKGHFSSKFHLLECGEHWWTQHLFLEDTKNKNTSCTGFYVFSSRCCLGQLKLITKLPGPASAIKKYTTLPVTNIFRDKYFYLWTYF